MDAKESSLQTKVLKYLNSLHGCKAIKVISANERGIPDIHVSYEGQYIVFELKSPNGTVTVLQKTQLKEYQQAKTLVLVARSLEQVKEFMERCIVYVKTTKR
jgi:Holliday junction resolvase